MNFLFILYFELRLVRNESSKFVGRQGKVTFLEHPSDTPREAELKNNVVAYKKANHPVKSMELLTLGRRWSYGYEIGQTSSCNYGSIK